MDDVQIHTRLKGDFADLRLDHPIAGIMSRGRLLRQRRQRLPMLGVLTIGTVAAMITVQSSAHQGQAFAAWTSHAQATDSRTAAAIDSSCRSAGNVPAVLPRRVLDRRGDFALSIYTDGESIAVCDRFRGSEEHFFIQGGNSGPGAVTHASAVTPAHPVVFEGSEATFLAHEGSAISAFGWVGPAVAKVVITSGDYTTTATLSDGLFSGWWPGDASGTLPTVTCTAYNGAGQVIGRDTLKAG
jgi:hypothetical protein